MVLDELWATAQEEMDFLKEAANMEEFAHNNQGIRYIRCPKLYHEYTTSRVLVMEYIGGCPVDDRASLLAEGYDLGEIGRKLVNNYVKQVMDDGFFHADPHPGNVKVMDGKIVWIDMGMMGRLSNRDRNLMARAVRAIAVGDIAVLEATILELGDIQGKIDSGKLYGELRDLMDRYGNASMGSIDAVEFFKDTMEIMKNNSIKLRYHGDHEEQFHKAPARHDDARPGPHPDAGRTSQYQPRHQYGGDRCGQAKGGDAAEF